MTTQLDDTATLTALQRLADEVGALVDAVDLAHWNASSPCPDLPAHALVEHLIGELEGFSRVARGSGPLDFASNALQPAEAARAYRAAGTDAVTDWSVPGRLATEYAMPWGPSTGAMLVGFLVLEQAVHGWDLARALGLPADFDTEAVAVADRTARAMPTAPMRVPGMFGPEVDAPDDAPPLDRLAAFLGRQP